MSDRTRNKYPRSDRFRGRLLLHLSHLFVLGAGVFWLIVTNSGTGSFLGVWIIGYAVFGWFRATRFAWRTWWDNRTQGRYSSNELNESDFHERRVRLALAHPYAVLWQSFFVMALMFWASKNPEFLSLHYGIWFYFGVLVIWCLVSLFIRRLARSELSEFDDLHRFDAKQGRFVSDEELEKRDS